MRDRLTALFAGEPAPVALREPPPPPTAGRDDLTLVRGIGPAYASRLSGAGISSLLELASADGGRVADVLGTSRERAQDFIEQARSLTRPQ
ncbi:MAG: helix-hairpin-helix domain-containing protein [Actinomycetota bacterium]|nr:helix-hairpin-helix domain-containing protein [Actinomycetota bacterium]